MRASLAGLILWEAKVKYGSDRAAARVLDVEEEDAEEGWFDTVGDPAAPATP